MRPPFLSRITDRIPVGQRFACRRGSRLAGSVSSSAPGLFFSRRDRKAVDPAAGQTTTHGHARRQLPRERMMALGMALLEALDAADAASLIRTHLRLRTDMSARDLHELARQIDRAAQNQKGGTKQ